MRLLCLHAHLPARRHHAPGPASTSSSFDDPESLTGGTALCTDCGREAVIGDKSGYRIDATFLTAMNEAWFQRTIIRKPQPKR